MGNRSVYFWLGNTRSRAENRPRAETCFASERSWPAGAVGIDPASYHGSEMDIIDRHFAAENAHDVPATLDTYTADVVWDDVGHPACPVRGKEATAGMYEGILAAIPDLHIE